MKQMGIRDEVQNLIRRLRRVPNVTAFAASSGVSRATLYRIMDGWANATIDNLLKIEAQLNKDDADG